MIDGAAWSAWLNRQFRKRPLVYGLSILSAFTVAVAIYGKDKVESSLGLTMIFVVLAAVFAEIWMAAERLILEPRRLDLTGPQERTLLLRFKERGMRIRTVPGLATRALVDEGLLKQKTLVQADGKADFAISRRTYRYVTKHADRLFVGLDPRAESGGPVR